MPRKPKITLDKKDRADQRRRTEKLIAETKGVEKLSIEPPAYFSDLAKKTWQTLIPVLEKMQAVKQTDTQLVESFCTNYDMMVTAYKDVQEHGQTQAIFKTVILPTGETIKDKDGKPRRDFQGFRRNPSTQIFDAATAKLKALASELGLTPASRASLINLLSNNTEDVDIGTAMKEFFS